MGAPNLTFSVTGEKVSGVSGYDHIVVSFQADGSYVAFECRATRAGQDWGLGKGTLVASFSATPANTPRTFEVYDDFLTQGDGDYRISLYVQGEDGSWNDNHRYLPSGAAAYVTAEGLDYLCMRG